MDLLPEFRNAISDIYERISVSFAMASRSGS